jgi:class 3 adenylate cyclase
VSANERTSETERRRATVLFADITGFSTLNEKLDPEEAYEIVTGSLMLLDGIARKHGGSVDKYLGDAVMAVFGIPKAIESAPKAAVNAAIEMHNRIHDYNRERGLSDPLDIHSGINTGLMISGDVSGPVLREFAVMGDAVNISARLKDLAPRGEIWVGPETYQATRDEFEYEDLDALELKGKQKRVPVYRLVSRDVKIHKPAPPERPHTTSMLVGRDAELRSLGERVARLRGGQGGIVSVVGDAGLGKSRLAFELRQSEEARDVLWLEGRSVSVGGALSFHPFADWLRSWAGIEDEGDDDRALEALEATVAEALDGVVEDVVPPLATAMGMRLPARLRKRMEGVSGESLETLLVGACVRLLTGLAARRPLVLVFEDVHWADQSSLGLLESLLPLAGHHPILFLLLTRPHYPETGDRVTEAAAALADGASARVGELHLEPLASEASRQLLDRLFDRGDVPAAIRDAIERRAAGNPFFIEEVVRALVAGGALVERDGGLFATERLGDFEIPGSVEEVITARVDRLPIQRRKVLQAASVIGREFPFDVLAEVVGEADLAADLHGLVDEALLEPDPRRGGGHYRFRHPLIQEVTYAGILRAVREALHCEVASAIESEIPETAPGYAGMLAYHFGLGNDERSAEEYLFRAGDEAARIAAPSEALAFFREAARRFLERHGEQADPGKRAELERKIAFALFYRGELQEAAEHFTRAIELRGEPTPRGRLRTGTALAGTLARVVARLYLPLGARARPPATPEEREVLELMFHRARSQTSTDPLGFLLDSMWTVRKLSEVDPRSVEMAGGMYAGAIGIFSFGGLSFALGRRFLELGEAWVDRDDVRDRLLFEFMRFVHHFLEGDWDERHRPGAELLAESVRRGMLWEVVNFQGMDGLRLVVRGEFEAAQGLLEELSKEAELFQNDLALTSAHRMRAVVHAERREFGPAREANDAYLRSITDDQIRLLGLGTRARLEALAGRLDAAREALAEADRIAKRLGPVPPFYLGGPSRARLTVEAVTLDRAAASGDRAARRAARRSIGPALAHARKAAFRLPEVLRLAARVEWLTGRRRRARRFWEEGLAAAARLGARPEQARLLAERALVDPAREGAHRDLDEARAVFHELSLRFDLEQLGRPRSE